MRCHNCKEKFNKVHAMQKYCFKQDCKDEWIRVSRAKQWATSKQELKDNLETIGSISKKHQGTYNAIATALDKGHECMMCGNEIKGRLNGCHYHSVGSNSTLRFNLLNIWGGCHSCNVEKGGNINGYDNQLIKVYGKIKWEGVKFDLVREYPVLHLTKDDIIDHSKAAREYLRHIQTYKPYYTDFERWKLREEANRIIGIYK